MTLSIPPEDDNGGGGASHDGLCIDCPHKGQCRSVRWQQRPCEIRALDAAAARHNVEVEMEAAQLAAQAIADTNQQRYGHAPWQRERVEAATPGGVHPTRPTPPPAGTPRQTMAIPEGWWRCKCGALNTGARTHCGQCDTEREITVLLTLGAEEPLQTFASGAKSSEHLLRYDLIPWHIFAERLAKRYTDGAVKYGEFNWQKGLTERMYMLDRANHALRHLHRAVELMRAQTMPVPEDIAGPTDNTFMAVHMKDDDLAAAMWGIILLMAAQRGSAEL